MNLRRYIMQKHKNEGMCVCIVENNFLKKGKLSVNALVVKTELRLQVLIRLIFSSCPCTLA